MQGLPGTDIPAVDYEAVSSPLAGRRAYALFEGSIRSAIHGLKYEHKARLAEPLGGQLASTLALTGWQPSLCTAVPLHAERLAERGYNQSALLAENVARLGHIPLDVGAIQRVRATRPQVGLNYVDRQSNMAEAFRASPSVRDQSIVIIDDVYTTGATLRACATALRTAGAAQVWALTVASAASSDSDRVIPR